jgi:hypothetical protein
MFLVDNLIRHCAVFCTLRKSPPRERFLRQFRLPQRDCYNNSQPNYQDAPRPSGNTPSPRHLVLQGRRLAYRRLFLHLRGRPVHMIHPVTNALEPGPLPLPSVKVAVKLTSGSMSHQGSRARERGVRRAGGEVGQRQRVARDVDGLVERDIEPLRPALKLEVPVVERHPVFVER